MTGTRASAGSRSRQECSWDSRSASSASTVRFPPPERFQDYGGLSRRLLRLSHIAFIALGALNVIYAREPGQGGSRTGPGGGLLLAGSALLPPVLALAAFFPQVRFAVGPPALLVALGCVLIASVKRKEKEVLS